MTRLHLPPTRNFSRSKLVKQGDQTETYLARIQLDGQRGDEQHRLSDNPSPAQCVQVVSMTDESCARWSAAVLLIKFTESIGR